MKAGSAEKMILNMLSTGAMTRLGYVYDNRMVHLRLKNSKLRERGIGIVEEITGLGRTQAIKLLSSARNSVPVALVMAKAKVTRLTAEAALKKSKGQVRKAIAAANP
jgi:N-acetylmuramic acid 6-phosphate etherase